MYIHVKSGCSTNKPSSYWGLEKSPIGPSHVRSSALQWPQRFGSWFTFQQADQGGLGLGWVTWSHIDSTYIIYIYNIYIYNIYILYILYIYIIYIDFFGDFEIFQIASDEDHPRITISPGEWLPFPDTRIVVQVDSKRTRRSWADAW